MMAKRWHSGYDTCGGRRGKGRATGTVYPPLLPCPSCSGAVNISASRSNGPTETTEYAVHCSQCGNLVDHFGDDGRVRTAAREWNRFVREIAKLPHSSNHVHPNDT